jgi:hypothetical protein
MSFKLVKESDFDQLTIILLSQNNVIFLSVST